MRSPTLTWSRRARSPRSRLIGRRWKRHDYQNFRLRSHPYRRLCVRQDRRSYEAARQRLWLRPARSCRCVDRMDRPRGPYMDGEWSFNRFQDPISYAGRDGHSRRIRVSYPLRWKRRCRSLRRRGPFSRVDPESREAAFSLTLAFVRIDPRQKKIPSVNWHSDDRPIFFIELRDHYVCTWCEMHDGRLILIPTRQSKRRAQYVRYPAEATIIGRVTGVTMDLVEPPEAEARA